MEVEGVKRIWLRSVADLKLQYTTSISDGDAKTFATLLELGQLLNMSMLAKVKISITKIEEVWCS